MAHLKKRNAAFLTLFSYISDLKITELPHTHRHTQKEFYFFVMLHQRCPLHAIVQHGGPEECCAVHLLVSWHSAHQSCKVHPEVNPLQWKATNQFQTMRVILTCAESTRTRRHFCFHLNNSCCCQELHSGKVTHPSTFLDQ